MTADEAAVSRIQVLVSEMGGAIKGMGEVIAEALKSAPAPIANVVVEQPKKTAKINRDRAGLIVSVSHVDDDVK